MKIEHRHRLHRRGQLCDTCETNPYAQMGSDASPSGHTVELRNPVVASGDINTAVIVEYRATKAKDTLWFLTMAKLYIP